MNPYGWKAKAAWPFIWLAGKAAPLMKWLTDRVDRWLDR